MNRKFIVQIILIVILLIVTIAIVHMLLVKASKSRGGKVVVHGTYVVGLTSSSDSNSDRKFTMNNHVAPTIKLQRGVYYEFINNTDEPLYFSSDSHGGPGAPGNLAKHKKNFQGLRNGSIFFIVTDDLPDKFYYQSGLHKDMGAIVDVS